MGRFNPKRLVQFLSCKGTGRNLVLAINFVFAIFGILICSLGAAGYREAVVLLSHNSANMLSQFDLLSALGTLLASGILTFIAAVVGSYGAYTRDMRAMKIYALIVFCAIGLQFAMGGFLLSVNASQVRDRWELATSAQRIDFQSLLTCCGFDTWMDSMGKLDTPCQFQPQPGQTQQPISCSAAIDKFLTDYVRPAASGAIAIACLEVFALATSCWMVFKRDPIPERYNAFDEDAL